MEDASSPARLRRTALAVPLAVVFLALAPAAAWGVADVIRNSGNAFDRSTYYSDQGDLVQYEHTGGAPHNVRSTQYSDGERLFSSDTIKAGTTPVEGTQYLAPGTYPFICTVHPSQMSADLVVRATGAPPPGPVPGPGEPGPGPGTAPLSLDLEAKKQELRKKLKFFATATADSTLVARGKAIKTTTRQLAADERTKVKARLKPAKRERLESLLERRGKATTKVKATATDESGAEVAEKIEVKLTD